ncbi:MAG: hypothetical protein P8N02_13055 [Actinomycetota bacterium]|nr:hypothetical protein [Actinomycetota bacterium]
MSELIAEMLETTLSDCDRGLVLLAAGELAWSAGELAVMGRYGREAADLGARTGDDAMVSAGRWLQGVELQVTDPDRSEVLLTEAARYGATAGDNRLEAAALAMMADAEAMGRGDVDAAQEYIGRAQLLASPDGFENLVISAAAILTAVMSQDWTAASDAMDRHLEHASRTGVGAGWTWLIERAVVQAELGQSRSRPLAEAVEELRASGVPTNRPDLLVIALGSACTDHDWQRAGEIISAIRTETRRGTNFTSPIATAIYLQYRDQVPREAIATNPRPIEELVAIELAAEA